MENPNGADQSLNSQRTNNRAPRSTNQTGSRQGRNNRNDRNRNRNRQNSNSQSGSQNNSLSPFDGRNNSIMSPLSTSFVCRNISTRTITAKYLNSRIISESYMSVKGVTLYVFLTLRIFKDRLDGQANVWARKILSMQELNLRHIIGGPNDKWVSELEKCFVYSYFSSVIYALNSNRVSDFPREKCFMKGHFILHRYLISQSFSVNHDDFQVTYKFDIDKIRYDEIMSIAKRYDFIKDNLSEFPKVSLCIEKFDRILNGLKDNLDPSGPSLVNAGDTVINESYFTKENFPIGNSFYSDGNNQNKWCYSFTPDSNIIDKTTLFGKACFLCVNKPNEISNSYDIIEVDDNYSLIKNEVVCLCGSNYPDYVKN